MGRHRSLLLTMSLAAALLCVGGCDGPDPNLPSSGIGPGGNYQFVPPESGEQGEDQDLVAMVCSKFSACGLLDDEELAECQAMVGREIPFVVDSAAFASCLSDISCAQLQDTNMGNLLLDCIDIDMRSLSCVGDSLHYCNSSGACKTTACSELCAFFESPGSRCVSLDQFGLCQCMLGDDDQLQPDEGF